MSEQQQLPRSEPVRESKIDAFLRYAGIALMVFLVGRTLTLDRCSALGSMRGHPAPVFVANTLDGTRVSPGGGKPMVLEFWASWCGPCRASLPHVNDFARTHPDIQVAAVNVESNRPTAVIPSIARGLNITAPVIHDADGQLSNQYHVELLPTVVVIDAQGRVAYTRTGSFDSDAVLASLTLR